MSLTIVVLCPNGRRQPVKVTPNTSILEVLEEACKKQGFNPGNYDICHYNRVLDLSLCVRFANIPNNALLELNPVKQQRKESKITIGLQLESGDRLTQDFSPSSSLWDVIDQCLRIKGDTLGQNANDSGEPVCIYMRQNITGDKFKETTLRNLGLTSGKAILRLLYRQAADLKEQAHIFNCSTVPFSNENTSFNSKTEAPASFHTSSVSQPYFSSENVKTEVASHSATSRKESNQQQNVWLQNRQPEAVLSSGENRSLEDSHKNKDFGIDTTVKEGVCASSVEDVPGLNTQVLSSMEVMDVDDELTENTDEPVGEIKYVGPRNAVLFNLEDISEMKKLEFPEEFYELTVDDARYIMNEYSRERNELENQPLQLSSHKQAKILQHLAQYRQSVIRIYFPDRLVLQGIFSTEETVQSIMDFVRRFLEDEALDFYLYMAPPKQILQPEKTLLDARLLPAAVIYFGCRTACNNYLKPSVKSQASDPRAASHAAAMSREKRSPSDITMPVITNNENMSVVNENEEFVSYPVQSSTRNTREQTISGKIPKWLKLSK